MKNDFTYFDAESVIIKAMAEVAACDGKTERERSLQFSALQTLLGIISHYKELGYQAKLLYAIAEKKSAFILKTTTKAEMETLLKTQHARFDGNKFIPGPYHVPEEELICWCEVFCDRPLNSKGYERCIELFRTIYPKESVTLQI